MEHAEGKHSKKTFEECFPCYEADLKAALEASARPTGGSKAKVKKPVKIAKADTGAGGGAFDFLGGLPAKKKGAKK